MYNKYKILILIVFIIFTEGCQDEYSSYDVMTVNMPNNKLIYKSKKGSLSISIKSEIVPLTALRDYKSVMDQLENNNLVMIHNEYAIGIKTRTYWINMPYLLWLCSEDGTGKEYSWKKAHRTL